ncbi:MAG: PilZ domain-containing protein [Planctomycetes bacterium]|nr:PilZ domain-containing protein [Planctomycetota bacterium]
MRTSRNVKSLYTAEKPDLNHRRHGRIRCEMLRCKLGEIADLSASGMRVRRLGRKVADKGDVLHMNLLAFNQSVPVQAKVVWVKKSGFLRYEFGLEFMELAPETRASIASLARMALNIRVISDEV